MASLYIDFGYDDNVKRSINSAKSSIKSRINDYNGIMNTISNTDSNTSNLSNANYYIRKKRDKLQNKWNKLDEFNRKIVDFNGYAEDKDKEVANRIKEETNSFYKRENIKTGFLYTVGTVLSDGWKWIKGSAEKVWDTICTGAKKAWEAIKDFYEKNKYWINVVVDAVILVAEIALAVVAVMGTGGAALVPVIIFGVWEIGNATADLVYDSMALYHHNKGNDEKADELAQKGLKDFMVETLGMGEFGKWLYSGMEIASFVYDITELVGKIGKVGKAGKKLWLSRNADGVLNPDFVKATRKKAVKECIDFFVNDFIGIKNTKSWENGIKNVKFVFKQYQNWSDPGSSVLKKATKIFSLPGKVLKFGESVIDNYQVCYNFAGEFLRNIKPPVVYSYTMPLYVVGGTPAYAGGGGR